MQGLKTWEDNTYDSTGKLNQALQTASNTLQNQFLVQIKNAGVVLQNHQKGDVDNLTTAIRNTGTTSNATKADRAAADQGSHCLRRPGFNSQDGRGQVHPGSRQDPQDAQGHCTTVSVTGDGKWSVQQVASLSKPGGKLSGPTGTASGWLVQGGTPGQDSVPIMAMPGELVVPAGMVQGGAVDHLRGSIPGFAMGGIVPGAGVSGSDRKVSGRGRRPG